MPEDAPPPTQASKDCIDAIVIPPQLPNILKLYTKAAMRTQPKDLLRWTYSYMKAMRDGKKPPVKDRGEAEPVERAPSGLTPGFLRVLDMMLRGRGRVTAANVREAWEDLSFNPNDIRDVLQRAELVGDAANDWQRVLVVFANTIPAGRNVAQTMRIVCEVLTDQPDGQEPYIKFAQWWEMYEYLAQVVGNINPEAMARAKSYLANVTKSNGNLIGPKDFLDANCPPLS